MQAVTPPLENDAWSTVPGTAGSRDAESAPEQRPGRPFVAYALILLLGMCTLNWLDRQVLTILAEPIKHEFRLQDWHIGALSGTAFALFYVTMALPAARLAERTSRPRVIGAATVVWSLFTILCAFTTNFYQLALARVGVGIGESGAQPAAHSLITSYVSKERRAFALGVYSAGLPFGTLFGLAFGGLIAGAFGWRTAFIFAGLPGLVVGALIFLTLYDPRQRAARREGASAAPISLRKVGPMLRQFAAKRSYVLIIIGATIHSTTQQGIGAFQGAFFLRTHSAELAQFAATVGRVTGVQLGEIGFLGVALGIADGLFGVFGMLLGGWLTDRLIRRDAAAYLSILAVTRFLGLPIMAAAYFVPHAGLGLILIATGGLLAAMGTGGLYASIQSLAPPDSRASASAVFSFSVTTTALLVGPLGVGLLSDLIARSLGPIEGLRWSVITFAAIGLLCPLFYWMARAPFVREAEG